MAPKANPTVMADRGVSSARLVVGNGVPGGHVAEIQRTRLLAGAVRAIDELGYAGAAVTQITSNARVSRRTFYELFSGREDCLIAVLDNAVGRLRDELSQAALDGLGWRERIRQGVWVILCFLEREPALARVCIVQSLRGGQRVLERRERILAELVAVVDEGRTASARGRDCPPLTAEGLVGASVSILYTRLLRGDREPLTELSAELTGMILEPYLGGSVARRERARALPNPPGPSVPLGTVDGLGEEIPGDPLQGVPMRLTYRTARVLEILAEQPGLSNRRLGEQAGISDQGQVSKLLGRLQRLGLVQNNGQGHARGEPNAWQLTHTATNITQAIGINTTEPSKT